MTKQEFENKKKAIFDEHEALSKKVEKRVNYFVKHVIGMSFEACCITTSGFRVRLVRDGEAVFGCSFDVIVRNDCYYNYDNEFVYDVKIMMNIGTCGAFEIGVNDEQEKKYKAFARCMCGLESWGISKLLIEFNESARRTRWAIRKLGEELQEQ